MHYRNNYVRPTVAQIQTMARRSAFVSRVQWLAFRVAMDASAFATGVGLIWLIVSRLS